MKTANVGDTLKFCSKEEKRNREVVGDGCGSKKSFFFFLI